MLSYNKNIKKTSVNYNLISTPDVELLNQLIQQKKLIKPDEYKGKVDSLRSKVLKLQKERDNLLKSVSKQRLTARNELLKNLNPIISEYMQEKKIRMVVDKKSILLADQNLDITKQIIELLNKKLKSVKLN